MENETDRPRFCGNLLVRCCKRRSFVNKAVFEGVFGVLSEDEFKYYRSSTDWTNQEKPQFSIQLVDIQAVEEVDDVAFSRPHCFQIIYTSHAKKEKSTRPIYLAAYEAEEQISWITSLRSACLQNPVVLAYFHPGRFTGKAWICCSESKSHHGCTLCTIQGLPMTSRQKYKVSPAIEFFGFTVIATESFDSNLPGCLPFQEGDQLTVTEAAGKQEWKAFSASSTSEYGTIPYRSITIIDIAQEPWYFDEIPSSLATALLREQSRFRMSGKPTAWSYCHGTESTSSIQPITVHEITAHPIRMLGHGTVTDPGCFLVRCKSTGSAHLLSFRTEKAVKHVEIAFDDSLQKYRIKDESDSVSYVNFLQFDSMQQLLDQCKHHPTLGITLDKYPSIQTVDELWRIDWSDISTGEEIRSDLPWVLMQGKFRDQNALVHIQREGCVDAVKEGFTNHARVLIYPEFFTILRAQTRTLCHENIAGFFGMGSKGSRLFVVHGHHPKASLSDYLSRNASLLLSHPSELVNIATQILTGMVYLEECGVVHGELIASNCILGDQGAVKISGFHCASSSWCPNPIQEEFYANKVPISEPVHDDGQPSSKSDVWAFGLLVYTIITAGQKPIETLEQVLKIQNYENVMDHMQGFVEIMTTCLRTDPTIRPTFCELQQRCGPRKRIPSSASASSYSLDLEDSFSSSNGAGFNGFEGSLNSEMAAKEFSTCQSPQTFEDISGLNHSKNSSESTCLKMRTEKNGMRFTSDGILGRLERAELEALTAKVLQRRAEADNEEILKQVREAEKKCLKEVELITRTFICRINEANDRTSDANQSRYIAEEAKRLAEEKFTLFKYESERTIHEMKTMLEDTILERDELAESLKSFGMVIDRGSNCGTPTRKDSIGELEKKYQRYISTSDRTIQNMKTQLDEVANQRDLRTGELNLSNNELRETRDLLEQAIKEKEDIALRLDQSNCEVEKLEETISSMVHKRQKAERERDQLQILTDMSLMKLRQTEKHKKRHSIGTVVAASCEKKDPNLRRLSMQLMNLRTPTSRRRQSADTIYEASEHSSSDETTFYSRNRSEDVESPSPITTSTKRSQTEEHRETISQQSLRLNLRCSTPKESDSEAELMSSLDSIASSGYIMDMLSKENEEKASPEKLEHVSQSKELSTKESEENQKNFAFLNHSNEQTNRVFSKETKDFEGDFSSNAGNKDFVGNGSYDNSQHVIDNHSNLIDNNNFDNSDINIHLELNAQNSLPYPVPTVLVDEFSEEEQTTDSTKEKRQSIPDIAISLVDDNGNLTNNGYFSEDEATNERVFIVPFDNGGTSMVYSFDSDGGATKGVPQTIL